MIEQTKEQKKAIADHDVVNDWLLALKESDPKEFERVRLLRYDEQKKLAGVA